MISHSDPKLSINRKFPIRKPPSCQELKSNRDIPLNNRIDDDDDYIDD